MGLKFVRNGMDSANLVSMFSVDGNPEGDTSFFSQNFWNHIGAASGAALKLVAAKFAKYTDLIQSVGLSDFAKYGTDGKEISNPVFPFKLRFAPNRSIANHITDNFLVQLTNVPANSNLYEVYALDKPTQLGGKETHIGTLKMDGKLTTSSFGDQ